MGPLPHSGSATTLLSAAIMLLLFCQMQIPTVTAISEQNQTKIPTDLQPADAHRSDNSSSPTSSADKPSRDCPHEEFLRDGSTCSPCARICPPSMYISTPCSAEMDTQCAFCPSSNVTRLSLYPGCQERHGADNTSPGLINGLKEMLTSYKDNFYILASCFVLFTVIILFCYLRGKCRTCTYLCQSCKTNATVPPEAHIMVEYINPALSSLREWLGDRLGEPGLTNAAADRILSVEDAISGAIEVKAVEDASGQAIQPDTVIADVTKRQLPSVSDQYVQKVGESDVSFVKAYHPPTSSAPRQSDTSNGQSTNRQSAHVAFNDRPQATSGDTYQNMTSYTTPKSRSSGQRSWNRGQSRSRSHVIFNDISCSNTESEGGTRLKSKTSGLTLDDGIAGKGLHPDLPRPCEASEELSPQQRDLPILHKFDTGDVFHYYLSDSSAASSTRSSIIGDPRLNIKKDVDQRLVQCIDDFVEGTFNR
ncbi:uncharacterized protein LOC124137498 [Haliotis rufescens]|uniref:uncharacterized protein LOC124137498 n=1 Tax=Haliotis rufescens TaxID=6454 RepID=UPI00201F16AD|nr:uncharacterized protein LOC124137498 [Haliotis rufescens]